MRRWGAAALGRWSLYGVYFVGVAVGTLEAQAPLQREPALSDSASAPQRPSAPAPQRLSAPAPIRYGKWLALAGAAGAAVVATQRHHDANVTFRALQRRCDDDPVGCALVQGHYVDPQDEALYQETRRLDHEAARDLIGGEVLFAAAAAGFVWELMHHHGEPGNIPFVPRVERSHDLTQVGVSVRF